jgi:hypothetical protein
MIMRVGQLAIVSLLLASAVSAQEPPDRLEKKPQPAEQKPSTAKPDEKPVEGKDPPKTDPADDAAKLREKIAEQMQAAEKKLKDRDAGTDTRQLQDDALRNIDKLLELARRPPPPPPPQQQPMDGSPPPMGGQPPPQGGQPQGGQPQAQPGTQQRPQSGQARRERREQRRQQMERQTQAGGQRQQPQQADTGDTQNGQPSQTSPNQSGMAGKNGARSADQMSDVVKDIWGHLPETLRQEVDHYYRDRFMPRYQDLLREYYQKLAERDRGRREDRK